MEKYHLENLDCASCAAEIERGLQSVEGISSASVDFATTTLYLDLNSERDVDISGLVQAIEPSVNAFKQDRTPIKTETKWNDDLLFLITSIILFLSGLVLSSYPNNLYSKVLFLMSFLIAGHPVLVNAARNILRGKVFDEHFLMSVATLGAIAINEIPEAAGVMIFYQAGEYLQNLSVNRSRRSIRGLVESKPKIAFVFDDENNLSAMNPPDVGIGRKILVRPGEVIPLDGKVLYGSSMVDTAPITGESIPQSITPGNAVYAGTINLDGALTIEVNKAYQDSSIARIFELVEEANSRKSVTERFITRFARIYSPLVVFISIAIAVLPPLLFSLSFREWLYRALVVLVISCPCALVISIPLGYFGGVGGASKKGILIKGSNYLDVLADITKVVFDKTGTLTKGEFKIDEVFPENGYSKEEILEFAGCAESGSKHPIAVTFHNLIGGSHNHIDTNTKEIAGKGIVSICEGKRLLIGNLDLMTENNIQVTGFEPIGLNILVAVDQQYAGRVRLIDQIKESAAPAITQLKSMGIDETIMLTGDSRHIAEKTSDVLKMDRYFSRLLPEDKVKRLEEIMIENDDIQIAYVGDGINDAPTLARADVGIAMGAFGSDAAIESADVVIMSDDLNQVAEAIKLGRNTRKIVWQNIIFALFVKGVFIIMGTIGEANMWHAVFADMGVALIAILNASRSYRS